MLLGDISLDAVSQKWAYHFAGPNNKEHSILGSTLGFPNLGVGRVFMLREGMTDSCNLFFSTQILCCLDSLARLNRNTYDTIDWIESTVASC